MSGPVRSTMKVAGAMHSSATRTELERYVVKLLSGIVDRQRRMALDCSRCGCHPISAVVVKMGTEPATCTPPGNLTLDVPRCFLRGVNPQSSAPARLAKGSPKALLSNNLQPTNHPTTLQPKSKKNSCSSELVI
jgi:hypothetical protein